MDSNNKPFRILSIDGGGIRGLFVARFLQEIEGKLKESGRDTELHKYFDLICGTSTGAIIAIGLSLGVPAEKFVQLYSSQAKNIFSRIPFITKFLGLFRRIYSRDTLEKEILSLYSEYGKGMGLTHPPRIGHAKTRLCIPCICMHEGTMQVIKTPHLSEWKNDFHIPMHQAALASSSAPVFFSPYSIKYRHRGKDYSRSFCADGGLVANNPSLIGYTEATEYLKQQNIAILSLGTGESVFREAKSKWMKFIPRFWSVWYWAKGAKMLNLLMQTQSQHVHYGLQIIQRSGNTSLCYKRIQFDFGRDDVIKLDESNPSNLRYLQEKAQRLFQVQWDSLNQVFFQSPRPDYQAFHIPNDEPC